MKTYKLFYGLLITVCIITNSCSFEKAGTSAGKGLGKGISPQADSIGRGLIAGIRGELANPETREKISKLIDSVLSPLTDSIKKTTGSLRDSLINRTTLIWADSLMQALTGTRLDSNVKKIQASLIGKTKADVLQMRNAVRDLLADVLSDTTKQKIALLRDELLGPKTNAAITAIVDTAMMHLDTAMARILDKSLKRTSETAEENVSFIHKHAVSLLITLGGIAAFIIFLVWQNRMKYLKMVTLLTKNIHDIPDQEVYNTVTSKIKSDAVTTGLEPDLRDILKKNGLIKTSI